MLDGGDGDGILKDLRFSQSNFLYHHNEDDPIDAHYTLGVLLGEGGFGMVYKGTHKKTGAERAIKQMQKDPRDKEMNDEIKQEFDFLKELDHPNLIKVYDMFEAKVDFHIVTDLYGGGDLIDYLEERKKLTEKDVQVFMNKLLSCIEYLHDSKLMVHRDLKLENVLLDEEKDLADMKLIDFGLARHFQQGDTFFELVGSTAYVAPQVIEGEYTQKCDIWSCGVIAYCLLCGYTPFEGYDDGQTLQAILVGRFDFADPAWDPISQEGKDFICNLLAYEEKERPSANQALRHPWLTGFRASNKNSTKQIEESLKDSIQGLKRFRSKGCKLKQAACAIMASQVLKKKEKEAINADFQVMNKSLSGTITKNDLKQALVDVNADSSPQAVNAIMEQVNFSGTGAISYSEFAIAMMFEKEMVDDKMLRHVFNMLDHDNDAHISTKDLQATLMMPEEACSAMLAPLGTGADGKLSFDQFTQAIMADDTMDGSNLLEASFRVDDAGVRRMDESVREIPPTVPEVDESLPEKSDHKVPEPEEDPQKLSDERLFLCFHWYMRFGHPDKKTMLRRVNKDPDCPLTQDDVERLPWVCGGAIIPVKEINRINQRNLNVKTGDISSKPSSQRRASERRASEAKKAETAKAAKAIAAAAAADMDASQQSNSNLMVEDVLKPSHVHAKTKEAKAKNMEFKPAFLLPIFKSDKQPLAVSSVLVGDMKNALTTKATVTSPSGQPQTIKKKRPAQQRKPKEMTIFANKKAARDFDWKSIENKELILATAEERKENKPTDFDWVSIAAAEQAKEDERLAKEAAAKKKAEEEARKKAEAEAKRKAEEEARRKAAEEARKKKEAEERARAEAEEKARLEAERRAAEEAARKKAEEEARKLAEEKARLEAERLAAEEAARKKAEEQAARKRAEEEAARKQAAEEAAQEQDRVEAKAKAAEEKAAEEKAAMEESAKMTASERMADSSQMSGSDDGNRRMSASEYGGAGRRSSTHIWLPGTKSAESKNMKFPKNARRVSTMVPGSMTKPAGPGTGGKRKVPGRNKTG